MRKIIQSIIIVIVLSNAVLAQQMPYYTQFTDNSFLVNPAVAGVKRTIDARLDYRAQWLGYDGSPRTETFSFNSRFYKGTMGAGMYVMQDAIGPSKQTNLGASYAYHVRFPDCELSAGVNGNFTRYTLDNSLITLHNTQDPAINLDALSSVWVADAGAGIYLYNDRFHVGMSAAHLLTQTARFYKKDSTHNGFVKYVTHINFEIGYNFAQNPDYVWQSTLLFYYEQGVPAALAYTLRLHIKDAFIAGIQLRLHDAVALQLGADFLENFQVVYSYDFLLSQLRSYSSGTHEIMIIFSFKPNHKRRGFLDGQFLRQKYGYLF